MTYQDIAGWSQIIAMVIFGVVMAGVLVYALRPGNKAKFDAAAKLPLENDDEKDKGGEPNGRT
ncbi:cbb3-type cytochrome c oxidase subunit 3 [Hyphomicrobium sp.]|uniref:cbb3-type cytochrome c oxidase subunit 3 n=1 Tax=Hyphomicrobium sp. TaxID=82 RepID=UPI0025C6288D|nr:cbb3-type cytochrome c oxidase subunit 3 [Hyphomicrobium sp.]MCC7253848.1 cbb3-type cytochrome c oxidase subunit 3 [Hyphomicrobium sp.]